MTRLGLMGRGGGMRRRSVGARRRVRLVADGRRMELETDGGLVTRSGSVTDGRRVRGALVTERLGVVTARHRMSRYGRYGRR